MVDKPAAEKQRKIKVRLRRKPVTLSENVFAPAKGDTVLAKRGVEYVPAKIITTPKPHKGLPPGDMCTVRFLDTESSTTTRVDMLRPRSDNRQLTRKLEERSRKRDDYREKNNVTMTTCRDNLAQLSKFAKMHTVTFPDGKVREVEAFTQTALGEPLGTTGVTVTRWVGAGMLPKPILETSRGAVYHIEEVRSFVDIISKHQETHKQYRTEHSDTKDTIFSENARVRTALLQPAAKPIIKKLKVRK